MKTTTLKNNSTDRRLCYRNSVFSVVKSTRGMSLVEVLVATAIMGATMLAMMSLITTQQRENKALSEKLAANEVMRFVTSHLENPAKCQQLLTSANMINPSQARFNPQNATSTSPHTMVFREIPGVGISAGQEASPISSSLFLNPAQALRPGIRLLVTDPTSATLEINFDQSKLVRPIKDLVFRGINLTLTGTPTSSVISACGLTLPYRIESMRVMSPGVSTMNAMDTARAECPTGWVVTGCSYILVHYQGGTANSPDYSIPISNSQCEIRAGGLNASAGNQFRAVASCSRITAGP